MCRTVFEVLCNIGVKKEAMLLLKNYYRYTPEMVV